MAEADRSGILQVGAAHHDDRFETHGRIGQRVAQPLESWVEGVLDPVDNRQVDDGGNDVVAGLPAVDVIVGMHRFAAATAAAGEFVGAPRDDLVGVHVGLGAAAGLEHHQGKLRVKPALLHLPGSAHQRGEYVGVEVELAQLRVDLSRGGLEQPEGRDDRPPPDEGRPPDVEVFEAALGLRAPIALRPSGAPARHTPRMPSRTAARGRPPHGG